MRTCDSSYKYRYNRFFNDNKYEIMHDKKG